MESDAARNSQTSKQLFVAVLLASLLVSLAAMSGRLLKRPSYDGKSVTYWIEQLDGASTSTKQVALEALLDLGPDAVPYLRSVLLPQGARSAKFYESVLQRLPKRLAQSLPKPARFTYKQQCEALRVLEEIGPRAHEAIPELVALIIERDTRLQRFALSALESIARGTPYEAEVLTALDGDPNFIVVRSGGEQAFSK